MDTLSLKEAFNKFSDESLQLEKSYLALQRKFTETLEKTKQTLATLVSHLSDGLIVISEERQITLFNRAASHLLERGAQEVLGHPYDLFFSDLFLGFSPDEALKKKGLNKKFLLTLENKKEIILSASFVENLGIILVLHDVTELHQLQKAFHHNRSLSELGQMAACLAHEIRNPLGGIEGFASLLERDLDKETPHYQMIRQIIEGARHLNRLVSNVLHYARPFEIHFRKTALVPLIQETIDLMNQDARKPVSCLVSFSTTDLVLYLDQDLFKMALHNLVWNAFQASKGCEEPVLVRVYEREFTCYIEVIDKGEGIKNEDLERIFTPFYTTKKEGTGLGLSEAKKVAIAHGGSLEVLSKVGEGSTFTMKLPLTPSYGH